MYTYFEFAGLKEDNTIKELLTEFVVNPLKKALRQWIKRQEQNACLELICSLELWSSKCALVIPNCTINECIRLQKMIPLEVTRVIESALNGKRLSSSWTKSDIVKRIQKLQTSNFSVFEKNESIMSVSQIIELKELPLMKNFNETAVLLDENETIRSILLGHIFTTNIYSFGRNTIHFIERYFFETNAKNSQKEFWKKLNEQVDSARESKELEIVVHTQDPFVEKKAPSEILSLLNNWYESKQLKQKKIVLKISLYSKHYFADKVHDRFFQFSDDQSWMLYFWGKGIQSWRTKTICTFGIIKDVDLRLKISSLKNTCKNSVQHLTFQLTKSQNPDDVPQWMEILSVQ